MGHGRPPAKDHLRPKSATWACAGCLSIAPTFAKSTANGIVGASAPLRLVHGAYSRFDGKPVVIIRDLEHHLLAQLAAHLLGHGTGFFRSPVPVLWVVELRCSEHGTRPFSDHSLTPGNAMWFLLQGLIIFAVVASNIHGNGRRTCISLAALG